MYTSRCLSIFSSWVVHTTYLDFGPRRCHIVTTYNQLTYSNAQRMYRPITYVDTLITQIFIFQDFLVKIPLFPQANVTVLGQSIFQTWPIIQLFLPEWMKIITGFGQGTLSRSNYSIIVTVLGHGQLSIFFLSARVVECWLIVYRYILAWLVMTNCPSLKHEGHTVLCPGHCCDDAILEYTVDTLHL